MEATSLTENDFDFRAAAVGTFHEQWGLFLRDNQVAQGPAQRIGVGKPPAVHCDDAIAHPNAGTREGHFGDHFLDDESPPRLRHRDADAAGREKLDHSERLHSILFAVRTAGVGLSFEPTGGDNNAVHGTREFDGAVANDDTGHEVVPLQELHVSVSEHDTTREILAFDSSL